jgi:hypothetical protein
MPCSYSTTVFEPEEIKRRQQQNADEVLHGGVPGEALSPASPRSPSMDKENVHEIEMLESRRV